VRSLPLFHRIAGQPVVVLGEGPAADAKRRLVERAGGKPLDQAEQALAQGARMAFVAHSDADRCRRDAARLSAAGLLVNVTDMPELCDFTVPSLLDRDPVIIAVGTSGASAGLAKQLRLRLEQILPQGLGRLAAGLESAREAIRRRWPDGNSRRRALDAALAPGGVLDPLSNEADERIGEWIDDAAEPAGARIEEIILQSTDPDDLTLRQARFLGEADQVLYELPEPTDVLARCRADAIRVPITAESPAPNGLTVILRRPPPSD